MGTKGLHKTKFPIKKLSLTQSKVIELFILSGVDVILIPSLSNHSSKSIYKRHSIQIHVMWCDYLKQFLNSFLVKVIFLTGYKPSNVCKKNFSHFQPNIMEPSRVISRPHLSPLHSSAVGTLFVLILSFYLVQFQPTHACKFIQYLHSYNYIQNS